MLEREVNTMLFSARYTAIWLRTAIVLAVAVIFALPLVIGR